MIERSRIRALCRRIAEEFRPERIILFGSHASGRAREDSDVDLLVVMPFQGKDDHRHFDGKESAYVFTTPDRLIADFQDDIARWNHENRDS